MSNSLSNIIDTIQEQMFSSIGSFFIKDLRGYYLCCNRNQLDMVGYKDSSFLLGKTDFDSPWHEYAPQFQANDQLAVNKKRPIQTFEHMITPQSKLILGVSHKQPFYHNGKIVGVRGCSLEIPLIALTQNAAFSDKTIFVDTQKQKTLTIKHFQKRTLYHLLQGANAKEIASKTNLSKRTVEHHLEFIKGENGYTSAKEILLHVKVF